MVQNGEQIERNKNAEELEREKGGSHGILFEPYLPFFPLPYLPSIFFLLSSICNIPTMGIALSNLGITLEVQANVYIFTGQN